MKKNYILIDFESIQPLLLAELNREEIHVFIFVGANQQKLPFDLVKIVQAMGNRGRYIQIASHGHNALDFHIAFYIGEISSREPEAYFHIISKDSGFDPLIQHLKERKLHVTRNSDISALPFLATSYAKDVKDRVELVVEDLRRRGKSRPQTLKKLISTVNGLFQKKLDDDELNAIVEELASRGALKIAGSKVTYAIAE